MKFRLEVFLIVCITFILLGVALFLRGFFSIRKSLEGYATYTDQPINPFSSQQESAARKSKPVFGRLVIILIDALRADFVLPLESDLPRMKYVESLIREQKTISFKAKANPPTVTLPRIKALTSGSIPGFVDVVLNFDSKLLQEDNIVTQLRSAGKKIVFYGDDTWVRLFPDHFIRSDGTTSFFVTDYTEVDNNVTRHLGKELEETDWDVMILHYLGLDHIGHLAGPYSPLVPDKLQEMDEIVKKIYETISRKDASRDLPSLLILCGDHGMSEQGSHGGSSPSETTIPIVFMSSGFQDENMQLSVESRKFDPLIEVQQIDVTPTLSALLGIPIPQNNLGVLIPEVLHIMPMNEQLGMLHANTQQLRKVFKENIPNYERDDLFNVSSYRAIKMHSNWIEHFGNRQQDLNVEKLGQKVKHHYIKLMTSMRDKIGASLTKYDLHSMGVAISLLWMVLISLVYGYSQRRLGYCDISLGLHGSFVLLIMFGLLWTAHFVECSGKNKELSHLLCAKDSATMNIAVVILFAASLFCSVAFIKASRLTSRLKIPIPKTFNSAFLTVGTIIHTFTLLASSFVEEEHQTWYFLIMTSLCLLLGHSVYVYYQQSKVLERAKELQRWRELNSNYLNDQISMGKLHCNLYQSAFTQTDVPNCNKTSDILTGLDSNRSDTSLVDNEDQQLPDPPSLHPVVPILILVVLCRVSRIWNQTGDKWAHISDVGDWLVMPENKMILSAVVALALIVTVMLKSTENRKSSNVLMGIGAIAVYCFRSANGTLLLPLLYGNSALSKGVVEARIVYAILIILVVDTVITCVGVRRNTTKTSEKLGQAVEDTQIFSVVLFKGLQNIWILLMLLLLRPHNIPLIAMICLQEMCLRSYIIKLSESFSTSCVTLLYFWMGQAAFFYQGNSNSISSIDVSSGYIGLEEYQPVLIGILMCLSTYSGPIFWDISLLNVLVQRLRVSSARHSDTAKPAGISGSNKSQSQSSGPIQNQQNKNNKSDRTFEKHLTIHRRQEFVAKKLNLDIVELCFVLALTRALPLAVYTVLVSVQRYHLFVWTVFSPKLLYEGMHTVVVSTVALGFLLIKLLCNRY